MFVLLFLGICSFLLCLALTPVCRDLAIWAGLVDKPDTDRKFHLREVPRIGGVPIVAACAGSFVLLKLFFGARGVLHIQHSEILHAVVPAAGIVFATGLIDDLIGLKPWQKLAGQLAGACLAISFGVRLSTGHFAPVFGIVASVVWLICCTNAVNLIDGMDGLASGVSLLSTLTMLAVALLFGRYGLALATVPLAGALLAFLRYNFSPASVFLGDCGSLTVGFLLGCFGLVWSQHNVSIVGLAAPLMALALPLTDVGLAIVRRSLRSAPLFKGDRGHIHHRVLALGFSTSRAALILYAACCAGAVLALIISVNQREFGWPGIVLFFVLLAFGIKRLGYIEFSAARKMLSRSSIRHAVKEEVKLEELRLALQEARSVESCWHVLRVTCRELSFCSAELRVAGNDYFEEFVRTSETEACDIELTLGQGSWLVLRHSTEAASPRMSMAVLNEMQASLRAKLLELQVHPRQVTVSSSAA